jgi:hypothetical protein
MYTDNTLTPREAIRLCTLGTLATNSANSDTTMTYDDLVQAVRHFVSRITGPSLELMGDSIELLRYEGLIKVHEIFDETNPTLEITEAGLQMLGSLLRANIRNGSSDLNELIIALKFSFFHQLSIKEQVIQIELMLESCESELARFEDLYNYHEGSQGYLTNWLNHNIRRIETRLKWLTDFKTKLKD